MIWEISDDASRVKQAAPIRDEPGVDLELEQCASCDAEAYAFQQLQLLHISWKQNLYPIIGS